MISQAGIDSAAEQEVHPYRVLLAEDDAAMRALVAHSLRRLGFQVVEAEGGKEAVELLASSRPGEGFASFDVFVSDIRMPGYSGLELLARLRTLESTLPVILITAFGSASVHEAALRLGAFMVLDKPFELDSLATLVSSATALTGRHGGREQQDQENQHAP